LFLGLAAYTDAKENDSEENLEFVKRIANLQNRIKEEMTETSRKKWFQESSFFESVTGEDHLLGIESFFFFSPMRNSHFRRLAAAFGPGTEDSKVARCRVGEITTSRYGILFCSFVVRASKEYRALVSSNESGHACSRNRRGICRFVVFSCFSQVSVFHFFFEQLR
jgi:hypothetical protein